MLFNSLSGYIGLFAFFLIAVFFKKMVSSAGATQKKKKDEFLQAEHEANLSRAAKIPESMYYIPDVNALPKTEYPQEDKYVRVLSAQKKAMKKSVDTMLRLDPPMKNIEIKQRFGAVNLERFIKYEENYEQYVRALSNWAAELIKVGDYSDAKKLLDICMQMNSLIFLPYSLLCDLYEQENDEASLNALRIKTDEVPIIAENNVLKNKINNYIDNKLSKLSTSESV